MYLYINKILIFNTNYIKSLKVINIEKFFYISLIIIINNSNYKQKFVSSILLDDKVYYICEINNWL